MFWYLLILKTFWFLWTLFYLVSEKTRTYLIAYLCRNIDFPDLSEENLFLSPSLVIRKFIPWSKTHYLISISMSKFKFPEFREKELKNEIVNFRKIVYVYIRDHDSDLKFLYLQREIQLERRRLYNYYAWFMISEKFWRTWTSSFWSKQKLIGEKREYVAIACSGNDWKTWITRKSFPWESPTS